VVLPPDRALHTTGSTPAAATACCCGACQASLLLLHQAPASKGRVPAARSQVPCPWWCLLQAEAGLKSQQVVAVYLLQDADGVWDLWCGPGWHLKLDRNLLPQALIMLRIVVATQVQHLQQQQSRTAAAGQQA
jgi:hypothetical protein